MDILEYKGAIAIPNGHWEKVFTSSMTVTLGPDWGPLAGTFHRPNREKLVWVNDGPPIVIEFWNLYPAEIHLPQEPAPDPDQQVAVFSVMLVDSGSGLGPLMPGMALVEGLDTAFQGASGAWYPGTVTTIDNLGSLPVGATGTGFDETICWEIPPEVVETTGTFCVAEYTLPSVWELMPEPSSLLLLAVGAAMLLRRR